MELRARLLSAATSRPGVLPAVCPGATRARLAVERELRRRGWPCAAAPASANLLVVVGGAPDPAGRAGPAGTEWIDGLWRGIPAPKARVHVREAAGAEAVAAALDEGRAALLVPGTRKAVPARSVADDHGSHEESSGDPMHDIQDMHIAGSVMADRADDRDGLRLDRLHVPLGPALPDWPAGLVLRLALQGDVVQQATVDDIPLLASARVGVGVGVCVCAVLERTLAARLHG